MIVFGISKIFQTVVISLIYPTWLRNYYYLRTDMRLPLHTFTNQLFNLFSRKLFARYKSPAIKQLIFAASMVQFAHDTVVPDKASAEPKKQQVAGMFDDIAHRYDFLNRFLSGGLDIGWRKKALGCLKDLRPKKILDVATGTADVAIMASALLKPQSITGIDISDGMLEIGRKKVAKAGLSNTIELLNGDSETISFADNSFDAVTVAFGVRNFQHLEKGLSEILRVLRPGGKLVVLEFSQPKIPLVKSFYNLYMKVVTPKMGKLFSKNKNAYQYLDESIRKFPEGKEFINILDNTGYINTQSKKLSLGICSIYCGTK
jgi:demethylmenaquinone methyltransferase / 2-methoxy-6-polyprenyl-1,4-benzoquinol methylase